MQNAELNVEQEKESHYLCEGGIEKSVPWDHSANLYGKYRTLIILTTVKNV